MTEQSLFEKVGEIRGELSGVKDRLGNVEGVAGEARDAAIRTEEILKRVVGSGLHPTVAAQPAQAATEPHTASIGRFLNRHGLHVIYGAVVIILGVACLAAYSGRDASSLVTYPTAVVPGKEKPTP